MLNKFSILLFLCVMGSCSKDELIPNKVTSKINQTEVKSKDTLKPKKKKIRFFRKRLRMKQPIN